MIEVVDFRPEQTVEWKRFLATSNNGTLFHDLDFLSYHPPGRFETHHLVFRRDGESVALLPAAIVAEGDDKRYLKSPYGASVGGLVLPLGQSAETVLILIDRLQGHACAMGLDGIEMRLGPHLYMRQPDEHLGFALAAQGFRLVQRWLTHVLALPDDPAAVLKLPSRRKAEYVRAAERKGAVPREVGPEYLEDFYAMLCRNRAKHGAVPTHSLPELRALFQKVPQAVRMFLCFIESKIAAGTLVFEVNAHVAYNFYPCHEDVYEYRPYHPAPLLAVHVAKHYAARQFRYLDLGPSTFDDFTLNRGAAFFKEGLGAKGFCRDTWRWERSSPDDSR